MSTLRLALRGDGRRLVVGGRGTAAGGAAGIIVTDDVVHVTAGVRADGGTVGGFDLRERLEGMSSRSGVGDRNVTAASIADGSVSLQRFAVLGGAKGGTGTSTHAAGGVAHWTAGGVATDAAFTFSAGSLACPRVRLYDALGADARSLAYVDAGGGCLAVVDAAGAAVKLLSRAAVTGSLAAPVTLALNPTPVDPSSFLVEWSAFDRKGELAALRYREYGSPPSGAITIAALLADPASVAISIEDPLNTKARAGALVLQASTTHVAALALRYDGTSSDVVVVSTA